jgi:tetratricopeptide (TPR) repeat protein
VTYTVQRAESLMGLCYLLVLYGLARGAAAPRGIFWYVVAALACLLGMATKEVMASAPLMALLYDRTFLAGSFREALRRRWGFYLALVATWPVLEEELVCSWGRGSFGAGTSPWRYLGTQCGAVAHYLGLCIWPSRLVLDYGKPLAHGAAEIAPYAVLIAGLLLATLVALWRWPKLGFLGAFFFVILAPSSSLVPQIMQTMAEHRMYLPLAAVAAFVVVAAYAGLRWLADRHWFSRWSAGVLGLSAAAAAAVALGAATFERNGTYGDAVGLWRDTLDKVPANARAQNNLGVALLARGELDQALELFRGAQLSDPSEAPAGINYGGNLARRMRIDAAIAECREAVRRRPGSAEAHANLAWRLATCPSASRRNGPAALEHALTAQRLSGGQLCPSLDALAAAYAELGRFPEAISTAGDAVRLAEKEGKSKLAEDIRARVALYQSGKPYRDEKD